ncbi:MAG: PD-(D/E)XK nuclease family protein [Senegalia sp. (in: firmicutes)]|uniref:PD-(D/E)XK nuclease family protein n=1 Tax=Senegalia sp. (in: firmicutes) TaxID=1924098 RepID=UPI003F9AA023
MNDKIVYFGDINNKYKDELIKISKTYIEDNECEKLYYILPSRNLLIKYRKELLKDSKGAFNLNVITFDDIVDKLINKSNYIEIGDIEKQIILSNLLKKLDDKDMIKFYKSNIKSDNFIDNLIYIIGEMKRNFVNYKDIKIKKDDHKKFKEIFYIYKEYQIFLEENNLLDKEEIFLKALVNFNENKDIFKDLQTVIIDEFFDFRDQEFELIKQLSKMNTDIYINIPYKTDSEYTTIRKTLEDLKNIGFTIKDKENKGKTFYDELSSKLFSEKKPNISNMGTLNINKANRIEDEIAKITDQINKSIRNGISPSKIAIVSNDLDIYEDLILKKLDAYNILYNLEKKEKMIDIPISKDLLKLINLMINLSKDNLIKVMDSPYLNIKEEFEDKVNLLKEERFDIDYIKKILVDIDLQGNIYKLYLEHKSKEIYYRDIRFINKLYEILENIERSFHVFFKDEFDINSFYRILKKVFEKEDIVIREKRKDGINIINPSLTRGLSFEEIYIVGLSEGKYPKTYKNDWFFNKRNEELLKDKGIIYPTKKEIYDKEKLLFAISISRANSKLSLSYSNQNISDLSFKSIFIDELMNKLDLNENNMKNIANNYDLTKDILDIFDKKEIFQNLLFKHSKKENIIEAINMYNFIDENSIYDIKRKVDVESKRNSSKFTEFDGNINSDINFIDKKFSISSLETYAECPIKYFFKYVLNIKEEESEGDFDNRDKGNIYHIVLSEFYSRFKGKEPQNIPEIIEKSLIRIFKNEFKLQDIKGIWALRIESMQKNIIEFLYKDLERLKKEKINPKFFEYKFGYDEDFILTTEDFDIKLCGKIDRIDMKNQGLIIYDYKTSSAKNIKDIEKGTSLQLPIYAMVMKEKKYEILETAYITLNDKKYSYLLEKIDLDNMIDIAKAHINNYIDGINSGNFFVKPSKCSAYCPYKTICRYNKERIERKDEEYDAYTKSEASY